MRHDPYPPDAIVLAPLAGYTDLPFRRGCRRQGCRYAFTPMVDACSLYYTPHRNGALLHRDQDEPWLGVQLIGTRIDAVTAATKILETHHFDVVDFNMGCPAPKVIRKGAGAALLYNPSHAARCVETIAENTTRPVTVKIRVLSRHDSKDTVKLVELLKEAGAAAVTIHARTRSDGYTGPVATNVVRSVAEAVDIPVIANGGCFTPQDVEDLKERGHTSRIMLARGTIGNPWLFDMVNTGRLPPDHSEVCEELQEHVRDLVLFYGESLGMRHARKIVSAFLKGRGYRSERRRQGGHLKTHDEFLELIKQLRNEGPAPTFPGNERARRANDTPTF